MNWKKLIVESGKQMEGSGLTMETWGNISCRDEQTQLVYLTPSAMAYNRINEDDVVVCKLDGTIVEGNRKPTIEMEMHLAVYRTREDVNAIIHTHPIYSTVYGAQGRSIPMMIDEAAQVLGDTCFCTDYALPGSTELAKNVVKTLGKRSNACLVHSHGAVCVGRNMGAAFKVAKVLEMTAQIYCLIESTGNQPIGISSENISAMQEFMKNSYGNRD